MGWGESCFPEALGSPSCSGGGAGLSDDLRGQDTSCSGQSFPGKLCPSGGLGARALRGGVLVTGLGPSRGSASRCVCAGPWGSGISCPGCYLLEPLPQAKPGNFLRESFLGREKGNAPGMWGFHGGRRQGSGAGEGPGSPGGVCWRSPCTPWAL